MRLADYNFMRSVVLACLIEQATERPSKWCVNHLRFDEAGNHGPFKTEGTEYVVDVLDDFARPEVTDEALVWGSQTHKTGTIMGGVCWCVENDPCGFLWVMPNETLVGKFSRQRLMPMMRASEQVARLIPTGNRRHDFATGAMMLGASTLNFMGSNSPANLSSNPCRRVILDEVDKFDEGGTGEADAVNLAEQRTKDQRDPQRWKTSTPTLVTGLIWQEFLKGNQCRWFMPCPHCAQKVVFAFSKEFTMLAKTGAEAYMRWDSAAKIEGIWNLEQVRKTAHMVCPHCQGKIIEQHKPEMNRSGEWRPTNPNARAGFVSRHLPSLVAASPETSFGNIAVKFLEAKQSLMGLQGFINGELAEPYVSQDTIGKRVELVSKELSSGEEWVKLMTVDCQAKSPHFWWVIRAWTKGRSEGIEFGHCDSWEELREIQLKHKIQDVQVMVDSGFGSRSDADVYRHCVEFCEFESRLDDLPLAVGWMPCKGMPGDKKWKDEETKLYVPFRLQPTDPFMGQTDAGQVEISLFEFSGDSFKDVLLEMRQPDNGKFKWSVSKAMDDDVYWRHLDGELKKLVFSPKTGKAKNMWQRRHAHWPNHLFDCEVMQVALATFFRVVNLD